MHGGISVIVMTTHILQAPSQKDAAPKFTGKLVFKGIVHKATNYKYAVYLTGLLG